MVKGTIHRVKLLVYNELTLKMNGWAIICNFSIENFMQSHISPTSLQLPQSTPAPASRAQAIYPPGRPELRMARAPVIQRLRRKVPVVEPR